MDHKALVKKLHVFPNFFPLGYKSNFENPPFHIKVTFLLNVNTHPNEI